MELVKNGKASGKGGFLLTPKWIFILIVSVSSIPSMASHNLTDIWNNNQAAKNFQQKKRLQAHEGFGSLLADKPFDPLFQFNMGVSFVGVEEYDKAIQMYQELLKLKPLPPEIEFATYYNLGVLNSMKGRDVEKALAYYQKALKFNPQSLEIKTNIELLIQSNQGKGKGQGKDKNKQDQKDQNESEDGEQPKEPQKFTNKPQQPKQFKSEEMSKSDVKKILEELKKSEQRIRAKHDRKGGKEADHDKNW